MSASEVIVETMVSGITENDRRMMTRALTLAAEGVGQVSPGPLVGCVVTDAAGEIAGEGFYLFDRVRHAETLALEQAGPRARGGTAYVSLEPHAHHGRTPPCTNALIEAGISRVIAPIEDPNPAVSGKGFAHLRSVGLELLVGLLANEAAQLNERYLHFMRTGRPFVHLKLAVSLDGKIATRTGDSRWIAGEEARARGQEFRHESDAILVGAGTVAQDDPLLTDRSGMPRRRPLVRVVLDEHARTSPDSQLARTASVAPVLLFTGKNNGEAEALESTGIEIIADQSGGREIVTVLEEMGRRSIQSVLVEGGGKVAGAFMDAGLVDKVTFFIAPVVIGGAQAPTAVAGLGVERMVDAMRLTDISITQRGVDIEVTGYPS
ncbi:MAG TPA: bifunctional diaminohydroxyphosphoribosylaminopyrimidine deaminase/5-amino-6-(5-phosphoribosylamino)uracil reductase RibD [Pyrinomonadaceae bacterium]|nr:bifunctional diaminohydroxyphosphoribosylaminopyrimidine deaminase/5-amino-6-(5-phosphoribosylamino)uracil reductase RibD [Pyrinomonadaceae bacterium]